MNKKQEPFAEFYHRYGGNINKKQEPFAEFYYRYMHTPSPGGLNNIYEDTEILFACESGSRAWGFSSVDSDYDVRFVYKRDLESYLVLNPGKDTIEVTFQYSGYPVDVVGWDIYKFLRLYKKGNANAFEWLYSPIVYTSKDEWFTSRLVLDTMYFSPRQLAFHYYGMAQEHYNRYVKGKELVVRKKYLYVMRALLMVDWYRMHESVAPYSFVDLVDACSFGWDVKVKAFKLRSEKIGNLEMGEAEPMHDLNIFVEDQLDSMLHDLKVMPRWLDTDIDPGWEPLNEFLYSTLIMS